MVSTWLTTWLLPPAEAMAWRNELFVYILRLSGLKFSSYPFAATLKIIFHLKLVLSMPNITLYARANLHYHIKIIHSLRMNIYVTKAHCKVVFYLFPHITFLLKHDKCLVENYAFEFLSTFASNIILIVKY